MIRNTLPEAALDGPALVRIMRDLARPLQPVGSGQPPRLQPLAGIRALLFDVYGTLIISASGDIGSADAAGRSRALREALEAVDIDTDTQRCQRAAAALIEGIAARHAQLRDGGRRYPEVDIRDVFLEILSALGREGTLQEEGSRRLCESLAVHFESRSNPTWPMPGCRELFAELRQRDLQLGIVSNAQFFTPLLFDAHLGAPLESLGFDPALCFWSYRFLEAKPATVMFDAALQTLRQRGVEAHQVLYIGNDRRNDVWPAAQSGMKSALFAGDSRSYRPRPDDRLLESVREDLLITELTQLLELLPGG